MGQMITSEAVLDEIEFELMQSVVSRGDLGKAVNAARAYQKEIWSEIISGATGEHTDQVSTARLLRSNELLLSLVEQLTSDLHALQLEIRRLKRGILAIRACERAAGTHSGEDATVAAVNEDEFGESEVEYVDASPIAQIADELAAAADDRGQLEVEVRSSGIPIIGGLVNRVRSSLHSLSVFYVNRYSQQQARVNAVYGDTFRQLSVIIASQQEQIDALQLQLGMVSRREPKK